MVTGLLDTSVVIDLLRAHPPAQQWISQQADLGITPVVWLEVIEGAQNLRAQRQAVELLRHFSRIDLAPEDFDWAIQQSLRFRLSHNVGVMDSLIASVSVRSGLPTFTTNLKHFLPLLGELAQKPY